MAVDETVAEVVGATLGAEGGADDDWLAAGVVAVGPAALAAGVAALGVLESDESTIFWGVE